MKNYTISIDAKTNGLWGKPFAIAAIAYDTGEQEVAQFIARIPDTYVTNERVKENVLPTLSDVPVTHQRYEDMLEDFADFYLLYQDATSVWHMGHIVEAGLFKELRNHNIILDLDAPYTPVEVSTLLMAAGYASDSVNAYAKEKGLELVDYGSTHNLLYDCEVTARVYFDLMKHFGLED